jgi:hypothetical protein
MSTEFEQVGKPFSVPEIASAVNRARARANLDTVKE